MALHTDTEIYKSTYDLSKLVTQLVANMPRNFKADFGAELRRRCMTLVMRTYEANTNADKAAILQRMRMEIETVNPQLFIALFGVTAVALSQSTIAARRRWASVFGLVGQPFWFYAAWETQQWGIFALCVLYTVTWGKGFYTNWISANRAAIAAAKGD